MKIKNSVHIGFFYLGRLLSLVPFFLIISCSSSFDKRVASHIDKECTDFGDSYGCLIDLQNVIEFDWDSIYIFAGLTTVDDIYKAVGFSFKCKHVPDNYMRIIFVKGNQVVNQSQYHASGGKVQFRAYDKTDSTFIRYTKSRSEFYVLKKSRTLVNEDFYDLYPSRGIREPKY